MLVLSLKVIHLFFAFAWMAGLLYLPRLLIYHLQAKVGESEEKRFITMERRLLRIIMTPSMIVVLVIGLWLGFESGWFASGWTHVKLFLVLCLAAYHFVLASWVKRMATGKRPVSSRTLRITNEIPTLLLILILILAVFKPF